MAGGKAGRSNFVSDPEVNQRAGHKTVKRFAGSEDPSLGGKQISSFEGESNGLRRQEAPLNNAPPLR